MEGREGALNSILESIDRTSGQDPAQICTTLKTVKRWTKFPERLSVLSVTLLALFDSETFFFSARPNPACIPRIRQMHPLVVHVRGAKPGLD